MAQYEEITIDQGTDVAIQLELVDNAGAAKSLLGHSVSAKMKKNYNSTDSSDILTFSTIVATPSTAGICTLSLTNSQTDALKAGRYVYDVEISFIDSDSVTIVERVLEGRIQVTPSVTK
mgnify:FL=1|jgi:hypothetical protein